MAESYPNGFQKACFPGASKGVIVWEWVNLLRYSQLCVDKSAIFLTFHQTILFYDLDKEGKPLKLKDKEENI